MNLPSSADVFLALWLTRGRLPPVQPRLGASVFKMTEVSRHRSLDTLRGYVRRVDLFKEHAGAAFL